RYLDAGFFYVVERERWRLRESTPDHRALAHAPIAAHAHSLLPADIDGLDVGPRPIGAKNRETGNATVPFVDRTGKIRARVELLPVAGPLRSLGPATLRICERVIGAVGNDC